MGIETVSLIIAAFVNGSLGIAALMRNFRSRLCIWFAVLCGILFAHDTLGVLESFDAAGRFASPKLHSLTILLAGLAVLLFLREIVPGLQKNLQKFFWGYLAVIGLSVLLMSVGQYSKVSLVVSVFSHLIFLVPSIIWMVSLARAEKVASLTRERLRLRYAFLGSVVTLAFFLTDAIHFAGVSVPPLGTLARVFYLLFLFQIFIRKELIAAEEVVARIALFGGIAVILSTIYMLLVSWVGDRPDLFFFNTLIASFVIIVLFDPIRNLTATVTRKLFLTRNAILEQELNALSIDLMGIVEPVDLSKRISVFLRKCLGVESSALYLLDRDGLGYVRLDPPGKSPFVEELSASSSLVEYMVLRRGRPFVLETIENDRDSFHSSQPRKFCQSSLDTMRNLGADFVIPFFQEARLVGFAAAMTGERIVLSSDQLRLFIPLSRQIALLLKNVQTFSCLRDRDKLAAVGEMAAGLAHEIKNPLGAIKGAAQLLKSGMKADRENGEFLKIIIDETDRLSVVLTDFLDYARPRRTYPQTSCDPVRVIEHTASMVLRDSKVKFEIAAEKQGLTIEADPDILKQVLLNLFINAIQAMEGHSEKACLKVTVRELKPKRIFSFADSLPVYKVWEGWETERPSGTSAFIEIEVQDNGPGIAAEDISRIFVPFFTTKQKGTGLGLAICQRLVEGMGGTIGVKSYQPSGSIFTIHVPVHREDAEI